MKPYWKYLRLCRLFFHAPASFLRERRQCIVVVEECPPVVDVMFTGSSLEQKVLIPSAQL